MPFVWPLGRSKERAFLRESAFSLSERTNFYGTIFFSSLVGKQPSKVLCEKNYTTFELNISVGIDFRENLRVPA